ncbi:MAG: hypothetical protein IPG89_08530 [Bacteroidetes bacterium]|nr:hypothetical protein [Bacteroidota bacterium]
MTFKNISIIAVLISSVLFTQCKKDKTEDPTPTPTPTTPTTSTAPATMTQMFAQNGVQAVAGQVSMAITQTVTLSGVKINIPSSAFITDAGAAVSGMVDISVKGIFTKSDIILTGAPANAAGKLISTKGCIKVSASQNSQTLRVNPGANVVVNVPESGTPVSNLKKYYAQQISVSDTGKIWRPSTDTASLQYTYDAATSKYYYQARLDSVAWLNTGYEWDTVGTKTTVYASLDTSYTSTNCTVYISLNGKMVVGAMYPQGNGSFYINNIPVGINVNFVVIAVKNGTYYSVVTPATITTSHNQTLTPQSTTLSNIQAALLLLP